MYSIKFLILITSYVCLINACPVEIIEPNRLIINFKYFSNLSFVNCSTNVSYIEFRPSSELILDNSLNMTGLTLKKKEIQPHHLELAIFVLLLIDGF